METLFPIDIAFDLSKSCARPTMPAMFPELECVLGLTPV